MPLPRRRYVNPQQLPSWNSTYGVQGTGSVPYLADGGAISPLLTLLAGGTVGWVLGGWKGAAGTALVMIGANNLGLAGEKTAVRLGVAALGLGVGGYMIHSAAKKTSLVPNPPSWLRRVAE
jgi:hypothetical protein